MSEQKLEKKKKKDEKKVKIDPIPKGTGAHLIKKEFENPDLRKDIIRFRSEGNSWQSVADMIEEKYDVSISQLTVSNIYNKEIAKATIVSPKARQTYSKYNNMIDEYYGKAQKLMNWWISTLEKIKDEIIVEEIMINAAEFAKFLRVTESIDKGTKSVLEQLKFIQNETEKVKIESKNYIYSPQQINQKIIEFRKVEQHNIDEQRKQLEKEREEFEKERRLWRERNSKSA